MYDNGGGGSKILPVMRYTGTAGQATDDRMTHVHYMLDNKGYRHTLRICNR